MFINESINSSQRRESGELKIWGMLLSVVRENVEIKRKCGGQVIY